MKPSNFEIIAGTYEEFLIGYSFIAKESEILQTFAAHDHSSSIRSLSISGQYLATGAADDRIIVYDLKSRKEHCMLTHHDATVTCLQFTNDHSHLLSGSSDGVLAIVRVGNWQVEKIWNKAHKGSAILDIAVHSSGKLALTLGSDCTLRTWNLVKGRQAYAINLNSKCNDAKSLDKIVWAEDGIRFILSGGKFTEVWSIGTGGILEAIEHDEKVTSCIWFSEDEIIVGYENGQMVLVKLSDLTKTIRNAHDGRVKVLALHKGWIISGSSTGEIKVWDKALKEVAKQNSGCRLTCLGIVPLAKIKKEEDVEEDQEEIVKTTAIKKSSVVIEIEDNNDDIYYVPKIKDKRKKLGNTDLAETETQDSSNRKRKKIKKSANASEDINVDSQKKSPQLKKFKEQQTSETERVKTKKRKQINQHPTGTMEAKQNSDIIQNKGSSKKRKK